MSSYRASSEPNAIKTPFKGLISARSATSRGEFGGRLIDSTDKRLFSTMFGNGIEADSSRDVERRFRRWSRGVERAWGDQKSEAGRNEARRSGFGGSSDNRHKYSPGFLDLYIARISDLICMGNLPRATHPFSREFGTFIRTVIARENQRAKLPATKGTREGGERERKSRRNEKWRKNEGATFRRYSRSI